MRGYCMFNNLDHWPILRRAVGFHPRAVAGRSAVSRPPLPASPRAPPRPAMPAGLRVHPRILTAGLPDPADEFTLQQPEHLTWLPFPAILPSFGLCNHVSAQTRASRSEMVGRAFYEL